MGEIDDVEHAYQSYERTAVENDVSVGVDPGIPRKSIDDFAKRLGEQSEVLEKLEATMKTNTEDIGALQLELRTERSRRDQETEALRTVRGLEAAAMQAHTQIQALQEELREAQQRIEALENELDEVPHRIDDSH